jgi:hypothetical protein
MRSESGARARKDTVRSRAASGIMLTGTTAGPWGASTGLGQVGAGNARLANAMATASQEAWPGAERKGRKPPGESRGGAPRGEPPSVPPFLV